MMGVFLSIVQFPFRQRQRRARAQRGWVTSDVFCQALGIRPDERPIAESIWDLLVEAAVIDDFRPLPDDSFLHMYGLAEEDLDEDIILKLLTRFGLAPPKDHVVDEVGEIASPIELMQLIRIANQVRAPVGD